ncbi:MAG: SGNH/GDSL hydrolase family protein [Acidobacteria bacterium]|nr:SGNH/GDSL hydrolase family protein [Acidobacteriota bacterium]
MDFSVRYVALGDSFTEGVGDEVATRPNGVRGWADRLAEQLGRNNPDTGYANLAIRGRKMDRILSQQIEPAIAMEPTLVTIFAGINDILRPRVDIDAMVARYDEAVRRLRATGAVVVMFTGFDARMSPVFATTRGRTAIYNELIREVAEEHGAVLADFWRFREYDDWRMWGVDRMHMSTPGHTNMAKRVLGILGLPDEIPEPELPTVPQLSKRETLAADAAWARQYVGPWIGRRVRGVSSGDILQPRWPKLTPATALNAVE